jgi:hypothetical protein
MKTQMDYKIPETLARAIDEVDRMLAAGNADLTLDFAGCKFVTVEGLEWLEELLLRAGSLNAAVRFDNVAPSTYKMFKVARIDNILRACGATAVKGPVC